MNLARREASRSAVDTLIHRQSWEKIFERLNPMPSMWAANYFASTAGSFTGQTIVKFINLPGIRD